MNRISSIIRSSWFSFRSPMRLQLAASVSLSLLLFRLLHLRYHTAYHIGSSNNTNINTNDWQFRSSTPPLAERKKLFRPIVHLTDFLLLLLTYARTSSRRIQCFCPRLLFYCRYVEGITEIIYSTRAGVFLRYDTTRCELQPSFVFAIQALTKMV